VFAQIVIIITRFVKAKNWRCKKIRGRS